MHGGLVLQYTHGSLQFIEVVCNFYYRQEDQQIESETDRLQDFQNRNNTINDLTKLVLMCFLFSHHICMF